MERYDYDLQNTDGWHNYNRPYLNPSIPTELLKIGGITLDGKPRLRVIWGGEEQIFVPGEEGIEEGWYFKYHLCFVDRFDGMEYRDEFTGETRRTSNPDLLPPNTMVTACFKREEIGLPRWVIEMWRDKGDCNGAITQSGYYHLLTVQSAPIDPIKGRGPYREVDTDILEVIRGMYHFMNNTTEAQREEMRASDEQKQADQKKKSDDAIWDGFEDNVERIVKDGLYNVDTV
jgi:hypothetical protein